MPVLDLAHSRCSINLSSFVIQPIRYPSHWQMLRRASFLQPPGKFSNIHRHICKSLQEGLFPWPTPLQLSTALGTKHKVRTPPGGTRSLQYIIAKVIFSIDNFGSLAEFLTVSIVYQHGQYSLRSSFPQSYIIPFVREL